MLILESGNYKSQIIMSTTIVQVKCILNGLSLTAGTVRFSDVQQDALGTPWQHLSDFVVQTNMQMTTGTDCQILRMQFKCCQSFYMSLKYIK